MPAAKELLHDAGMSTSALTAYLLAAMTTWMPPKEQPEGVEAALRHYEAIAADIAAVALDPEERPVFAGEGGRAKTALLLASIASLESGFRADVDDGRVRGDHGRSWCLLQVQVWSKTKEGWRGSDLTKDRQKCITAGLHLVQASYEACPSLPLPDRLSVYTVGHCQKDPKAENRTLRAIRWMKEHALEKEVVEEPGNGLASTYVVRPPLFTRD
jgi:hypothetical protein